MDLAVAALPNPLVYYPSVLVLSLIIIRYRCYYYYFFLVSIPFPSVGAMCERKTGSHEYKRRRNHAHPAGYECPCKRRDARFRLPRAFDSSIKHPFHLVPSPIPSRRSPPPGVLHRSPHNTVYLPPLCVGIHPSASSAVRRNGYQTIICNSDFLFEIRRRYRVGWCGWWSPGFPAQSR